MFKKLSSLFIIFAVAISLIVLSQIESNAQSCGGCGQPPCILTLVNGNWIWTSYEAVYDIEGFAPLTPNIFIASSVYVRQGCLACLNPQTGEERLDSEPVIGTTAEFFSPAEDLQPVGDGFYTLTKEVCATVVEEECGECVGNVSELTLKYNGLSPAIITVWQYIKGIPIPVFIDFVKAGAEFTVSGLCGSTLGPKIKIKVNGELNTIINTSCSEPVGPGLESDDFTVISGYSKGGGPLCPLDGTLDGSECLEEEFVDIWDLPVNACAFEGFISSEIRVQSLLLTGRILDCTLDANGNPYLDDNGQPDDCSEEDIICLSCVTDEECETWDADGEVNYVCEEISCQGSLDGLGVTGTVLEGENDYGTYAWPVPNSTISPDDNIEFIREATNATTSADFTSNTLTLKYENTTTDQNNITYSPLAYTFEFESDIISVVNLQSSTFSQGIDFTYTASSITLYVPMQNTNPGEVFESTFELTF